MKEFHPVATAVDRNGKRTFYFLKSTAGLKKFSDYTPRPAVVLDEAGFIEYVRQGKVQMFQDFGNGPTVCYTEEEEKIFGKIAKKAKTELNNNDDAYWNGEVTFRDEAVEIEGSISISAVALRKMIVGGQLLVQGAVYLHNLPEVFHELVRNSAIAATPTMPDFYMCNWLDTQFISFLALCKDIPATVCTATMQNLDSAVYKFKMPMFNPASQADIADTVRRIGFTQPTVPEKPSRDDTTKTSQYQFLINNAHKLLADSFNDGDGPELLAAVVTCDPNGLRSSYETVEPLAQQVSARGWLAATKPRLCESPLMGIVTLAGWRPDAIQILINSAYSCCAGSITSIHVYQYESRELKGMIKFDLSGGVEVLEGDKKLSGSIGKMSLL